MSEKVKPGYKQTEVGVIPEGWNVHTLRSCLSAQPDYGINAPAVPFSDKLPAYIRITDITEDGRFSSDNPVSVQRADADRYYLNDGNIVFARTGASVGKSYLYKPKDGKLVFAGFLIRVSPDAEKLVPAYLSGYVTTGGYWSWVRLMSMRSGQPGINGKEYGQLPIPLPPTINEQRAIAGALSDVDALIGALDSALSKKRDLKQAAMQQLLTGQKRLPGFEVKPTYKQTDVGVIPEDWDISTFSGLFDVTAGGDVDPKRSASHQDETHCYPIYSNALTNCGLYGYCSYADHQAGSITITARGTLGCANFRDHPYTAIGRVLVLQPKNEIAGSFFAEVINNRVKFAIESTGVPQLTAPQISTYRLLVPPLPEQTAIAEVLLDMDAELAALTQRRDKTRALKQGMMQELLTGRTRLV